MVRGVRRFRWGDEPFYVEVSFHPRLPIPTQCCRGGTPPFQIEKGVSVLHAQGPFSLAFARGRPALFRAQPCGRFSRDDFCT